MTGCVLGPVFASPILRCPTYQHATCVSWFICRLREVFSFFGIFHLRLHQGPKRTPSLEFAEGDVCSQGRHGNLLSAPRIKLTKLPEVKEKAGWCKGQKGKKRSSTWVAISGIWVARGCWSWYPFLVVLKGNQQQDHHLVDVIKQKTNPSSH